MREKRNQREVGHFNEYRLSATEGRVGLGKWSLCNRLTVPAYNSATTTLQELSGKPQG